MRLSRLLDPRAYAAILQLNLIFRNGNGLTRTSSFAELSTRARVYLALVGAAALGVIVPCLVTVHASGHDWLVFAALASAAGVAQLFPVFTPRNQSYQTSLVFVLAAVLLLPLQLAILVPIVQHIPEWIKIGYAWFIQTFNIANHTIDVAAAWTAAYVVGVHAPGNAAEQCLLAAIAAALVYVPLNHALLVLMLRYAHGHSVRATGLFTAETMSTELALASLGAIVAELWMVSFSLVLFALVPLVVIQRAFSIPQLEAASRVDAKTGLFNARHLNTVLDEELARASRFGRPLSLLMADLDLLREINNQYGHLAGDAVLDAVASILRACVRDYDVPARFGGEEFAILLPETNGPQAHRIAARIREAVEAAEIEAPTVPHPLRVSISIGVATFPRHASSSPDLIHAADLAVYQAKLQGRNRVIDAGHVAGTFALVMAHGLPLPPTGGEPTK
jgi:diguanylate cyclase